MNLSTCFNYCYINKNTKKIAEKSVISIYLFVYLRFRVQFSQIEERFVKIQEYFSCPKRILTPDYFYTKRVIVLTQDYNNLEPWNTSFLNY